VVAERFPRGEGERRLRRVLALPRRLVYRHVRFGDVPAVFFEDRHEFPLFVEYVVAHTPLHGWQTLVFVGCPSEGRRALATTRVLQGRTLNHGMDSLSDPGRLWDDEDVDWRERTHDVDAEAFEETREHVDSHAVVGITDDDGRVLCHDDGSHGWTLPAATVPSGGDWATTARRELGELLDATVTLAPPERVRHLAFVVDDAQDSRRADTYDVVFPARVDGEVLPADEATDTDAALAWFDAVPAEQDGPLADDVALFLE